MTSAAAHHPLGGAPERSSYQPRRTSTLAYQNPGSRDSHQRTYSRSSRNVVVIIPSPDLPLDRGPLGNVLSVGPRHRLSQGILMPLFPSMLGQLNAIAREYNFPSTVGLCLYLHINEHGVTRTPRISDDSWQYLFGHLFDGHPYSGQRLPIGGSLEFDIDLVQARWFDAWASGSLQDSNLAVVTSMAPFEAHWRGESRTTKVDGQQADDRWNPSWSRTVVTNSRPETLRHLPKKLSLVDRLDSHGVCASSKSPDHPGLPASPPTHGTYASSPILQSAPTPVTESDMECRVNSWRETAELYPLSMAETYQPAPDVGAPGSIVMDEYALERTHFQQATHIGEFLWAETPAEPHSPTMNASFTSSIHFDRRANGTVPLTPATMTSWGPTDDGRYSVVSSVTQLPSPDMGERVIEDIMAPRPRPLWGNSFGWHSAMTWKQVYPFALFQTKPTIRVQLQDPPPHYPDLAIYPAMASQTDSRPLGKSPSVWGSSFGWQGPVTWRKPYPYSTVTVPSLVIQLRAAGGLESKYPNICIYPAAYPRLEIYPACAVEEDISQPVSVTLNRQNDLSACYPGLVIYPAMYPHLDIYPSLDLQIEGSNTNSYSLSNAFLYPNIVLYPAVYPHFDIYPTALQISETLKQEEHVDVRLVNAGSLTSEYPNMTIYPGNHSFLEIYPMQDMRQTPGLVWGISFGWMTAKTWLQVYPLHTAVPLTTMLRVDDRRSFFSSDGTGTADGVASKQAVWGTSFGWKSAATWRAVWPISHARSSISVQLGQQRESSSGYPYLVIYPATYPHIDIYPSLGAVANVEVSSQPTKGNHHTTDLIPHYPNLATSFAMANVAESGKRESNLRRRRIEMWRVKTAAQVGLVELLANNHVWEAEEALRVDLTDYAWSQTSAGPRTPLDLLDIASISSIDCRIRGSVLRTPSTATTWGPQDGEWYSEVVSIERLPSQDLGQRFLDDAENVEFPIHPWHMVWPFFRVVDQVETLPSVLEKSVFVSEYPHLVIFPPTYPHFELYPTRNNGSTPENEPADMHANSIVYPAFNIYSAVYPYFDIYPAVSLEIEDLTERVWHERIEVNLVSMYPNFDIYPVCYPYNLYHVYPCINVDPIESTPVEAPGYAPLYPLAIPYPDFSVDGGEYELAKASLALSELEPIILGSVVYPHFDLYPATLVVAPQLAEDMCVGNLTTPLPQAPTITRGERKTHMELRAAVFRSLGKQPARGPKTHLQLHSEVFRDGAAWSPSGDKQDLSPPVTKKLPDVPAAEPRHRIQDTSTPRPSRSKLGTTIASSPDRVHFPHTQALALPPLRIRNSIPSQPPPAVSESPTPRLPSPTGPYGHVRMTSARFTQAVKSMIPGRPRRSASVTLSPFPEDHKERAKSPTRLLSLADQRTAASSPPPHASPPEFFARTPRTAQPNESFVLQRAKAYEQTIASSGAVGKMETHSPFILPPLPLMSSMTGVAEAIEKSKATFP